MMRARTAAILTMFAAILASPVAGARAEPEPRLAARAPTGDVTDLSAQQRTRRPPTRVRIYRSFQPDGVYPRYFPGSDAVRVCNASYVKEYRPSGTVITPRVSCAWRRPG
jgi:hypothetical protein